MLDRLFRIVAVYMVINLVVKQFVPSDVLEGLGNLDASTSAGEVTRAPSQPAAPKQPVVYRPFGNYGEPFHIQFSQQLPRHPSTQDDPTTTTSLLSSPNSPSSSSPKQRLPKKNSLLIPLPAPVEPQWSDLFPLIPPLWARQDTLREMEASASAVELMLLEEHDTQLLGEVTLPVDVSHCYWLSSSTPLTTSGNEAPSSSVAAETIEETDRLSEKTSAIDDLAATTTTTTKDSAVLVGHYCSINVTATMTLRGKSHTLTIPLVFSRNRSTVLLSQLPGASPRAANYRFRHVVNLDLITDAAVAAEVQQGIIPTHWFVPPSDFRMPEPSSASDAAAAKKLPPVMVPHFPILLVRTGWDTPKLVKPWSSVLQKHGRVAYATFRNGSSSSSQDNNNKAPTEGDATDVVRHEDDSSSAAAGAASWQRSAQPILMNVTLKLRSRALRGAVADYQLDSMLEKFPVLDNTEDTRRIFLEGDPLLLMITMFAMLLHMIFEGLALKNDVSYWRNRQVFTGISLRTLLIEFYVSLIVFCYLMLPSCPSASEAAGSGVLMNALSASSGSSSIAPKEAPTSFLLSFAAMVSNLVSANHNDTSITPTSATVHSPSSTTDAAPREETATNGTHNNNNSSFYFQYSSDELSSATATQTFFETRNKQQLQQQQQQQSLKDASAQAADSVVSMVNAEHHSATTTIAAESSSSSSSTSSFKYSDFVGCRHTTRDDDTSLLILVPQGLSVLMCIWKICKAFHISIGQTAAATIPAAAAGEQKRISGKDNNKINSSDANEKPREWISVSSNNDKDTQAYDKLAVGVLLKITGPTLLLYSCYTYYQEIYSVEDEHSRTYIVAWLLTTQVRFIYIFGFIQMTPQLFINYKLKSVVHLPWRTFVYKALNTVVDDLFAFAVRMPFLHRIACFRDDIVFVILLYQRWIYPVDQKRTESGFVREEAGKGAEEMTQQKAVLQSKKQE